MREIVETFNVYTYKELSDKAKEKVKEWYLNDDTRTYVFSDDCNNDLENLFDGDLKVQYSLNYCQGDGLNIYGSIYAEDIIKSLEDCKGTQLAEFEEVLTEKEKRTILCYAKECGKIELPENRYYTYSLANKIDIVDDWSYTLENSSFKNINYEVLEKFEKLVRDIFSELCRSYEKNGYDFFYEIDEELLSEECDCNGWEFYGDGEIYA